MGSGVKFFCALVLVLVHQAENYCLEPDFPIVYFDPFAKPNHPNRRDSYFGFSTVLYPGGGPQHSWVQVGAPRAYSDILDITEPGMIARCQIFGPCLPIDVDDKYELNQMIEFPDGTEYYSEDRNKSWIGVAMDIDYKHNITTVCGHRWVNMKNRKKEEYVEGVCYLNAIGSTIFNKTLPLLKETKDTTGGQVGMSVHFPETKEKELILGAPSYKWKGVPVKLTDFYQTGQTAKRRKRQIKEDEIFPFGNINIPKNDQGDEDEYLGYSITSGYYFGKNEIVLASSLPRRRTKGSVLLFKFQKETHLPLEVLEVINGTQTGEYFGGSITTGDIDGDGYDDLVVGSPHYGSHHYDEGRVQIFYGSKKGSLRPSSTNGVLVGKYPKGQFGLAICSLGDIDWDGFSDIAISAPYELEGSGVVYIHMGSALGVRTKHSQKLIGKLASPGIQAFGISISKPADVDGNFYNDVAIGAYKSGQVVLYRSRKVVVLRHSLQAMLDNGKIGLDQDDFQVSVCVWFEGKHPPPFIKVNRTIIVDDIFDRGNLLNEKPSKELTVEANQPNCENITIKMKSRGMDDVNLYDPFRILVSLNLVVDKPPRESFLVSNDSSQSNRDRFDGDWAVENPYQIQQMLTEIPSSLGCRNTDVCVSNLKVNATFFNTKSNDEYVIGSQQYIQLRVTVINSGENAYSTQIIVEPPKNVFFKNILPVCETHNRGLKCHLANPLMENFEKYLNFDLDMSEINRDVNDLNSLTFNVTVLTSSNNTNNNFSQATLHLVREADIELTGVSEQEYYYMNISKDSANFTQIFRVQKFGHSPIKKVALHVEVPIALTTKDEKIKFLKVHDHDCFSKAENESDRDFAKLEKNEEVDQKNKTFLIDCSSPLVECCKLNFELGPFTNKKPVSTINLRMLINASSIATSLLGKEVIKISTYAEVGVLEPKDLIESGSRSHKATVTSLFTADKSGSIAIWIIILAILAGIAILALAIFGLVKAGFFKRTQRMELQAMKKEAQAHESDVATVDTLDAFTMENLDETIPIKQPSSVGTFRK